MAIEGYVDFVNATTIRGWVYDVGSANDPLTVEVLAGGRVVATMVADGYRADLEASAKGNGKHAFHYESKGAAGPLTVRLAGRRWAIPNAGPSTVPGRFQAQLAHSLEFGYPAGEATFTEPAASPDEPAIAHRLIESYNRARRDDPGLAGGGRGGGDDVWTMLTDLCHREIADLLRRGDAKGVAAYLRDAHAHGLTHGITQGHVATPLLRHRGDARNLEHSRFVDNLVSVAEYLGVLDVESPEQHGQWAENLHESPDDLVAKVSAAAGVPVVPPQVMGSLLGIRTAAGVLSGRDLLALYAALRLRSVTTNAKLELPTVCEIGGGLGGVAYYTAMMGGFGRHTIIDLPLVNVLQGYYLLRALPGKVIRLYGESAPTPAVVEVLPTFSFDRDAGGFDVLFNMDSMPEMHPDYGLAYLRRARARAARLFLSINQEARALQSKASRQTVVRDLVKQVGGYTTHYRFRHWLRAGYVEELFAVDPA